MEHREALLLLLGATNSPVRGRTAVQKMIYFTAVKTASPKQWGYRPHYYGPYSDLVASGLQDLVNMGFVEESSEVMPNHGVVYTYSLTTDGRAFVKIVTTKEKRETLSVIRAVLVKCREASRKNVNVLSWAAKTYFLLTSGRSIPTIEEVKNEGMKLGWSLEPREISEGIQLLQALQLVRTS